MHGWLRALSPLGCELTLRKLEPHADVDSVRSLVASPPTIETCVFFGRVLGTSIRPDARCRHYLWSDVRRTLNFASTFAKT